MSKGWHLVARLGGSGSRYPHVLLDPHGWCLRLGPVPRDDDKFYSRLDTLLQGLVEHCTRHRLIRLGTVLGGQGFVEELRDCLASALEMGRAAAQRIVQESSVRPVQGLIAGHPALNTSLRFPARDASIPVVSPRPA